MPGRVAPRPRPLLLCAALRWGDDGAGRGAEGVANKDGGTGGVSERPRAERVGVGPGMRVSFIYVIRWQIRGSVGDPRCKIRIRPKPDTVWVHLKPKPLDLKPADIRPESDPAVILRLVDANVELGAAAHLGALGLGSGVSQPSTVA